jgi:predicted phosphodiesterase
MKIQIHSDIHLEKYPHRRIQPKASTLILAGDIGVPIFSSYKSFFNQTFRHFDQIYYVLGNHEYERAWIGIDKNNFQLLDQRFKERNALIKDMLSSFPNIKILDNQYTNIGSMLVFGGTLWSNFGSDSSPTKQYLAQQHQKFFSALNTPPDLLITHYASRRSSLIKPWSIGIGPKEDITIADKYVFGHIHYPIYTSNVVANPWGERNQTEPYVWTIKT